MERINQSQLAAMIIFFQIGSSPLFLLASEAGQDAWISVFIGMLCGALLLIAVTLPIHRMAPDQDLSGILNQTFGRVAGSVVGIAYIVYFCYKAVRNLREFGDLMNMFLLPNTPISLSMFIILTIAGYAVYHGVEVFARVAELTLAAIIIVYVILFLMMYFTHLIDFHRLEPILDTGIKKVLNAAIPEVVSFPFGEMVLFLMFWKYAGPAERTPKVTMYSFLIAGTFITLTTMIIISSLGPLAGFSVVPLIQVVNLVEFANFIERLDPLVALLLFGGVFMKMTAYFFGAALLLAQLLGRHRRTGIIPAGILIFVGSLLFRSYMQQVWFGFEQNLKVHFPIFQVFFPTALLLAMWIKSAFRRRLSG